MNNPNICPWPKELLDELNQETLALLEDLKTYITTQQADEYRILSVENRLHMFRARSALTLQLTGLVGWVLFHSAQQAGDSLPDSAVAGDPHDAMAQVAGTIAELPTAFQALMRRGNDLYQRIALLASLSQGKDVQAA